jgi:hypothetical protein
MSENNVTITMDREAANALWACLTVELSNEFVSVRYLANLRIVRDALHNEMRKNND